MKVNILTLGCSKNTVDSETLATYLAKNQIDVQFTDNPAQPGDLLIINTCGFILDAKEESIQTILDALDAKANGQIRKVFVMGCLVQRYKNELEQELAQEVDGFFGVNQLPQILQNIGIDYRKELVGERLLSTPKHFAYLKISEGCDRKCAFCAIPLIRGKHRSVPMEQLLKQAEYLRSINVKELIIIAQDTTYYGIDLYGKPMLHVLLEELAKLGFPWIRLHYTYPSNFPRKVIAVMEKHENICNYLDLPIQHITDKMLNMMRRGHTGKHIRELINFIRQAIPSIAIRTTLIVGHPGETEADFQQLYDFVAETRFDRLGVFTYSHEEGTYAGLHYADEIPEQVKIQRRDKIMELQQQISLEKNLQKVGKTFKVLLDRQEADYFVGRTQYDSPEIDNEVIVYPGSQSLEVGEFYEVKITDAFEYDLVGEVLG